MTKIDYIFVILSVVATICGIVPYLIDVIKGKTKPRVISWLVWSCLTGVSFLASLFEGQYPTAVLMFCSFVVTFAVVILGWKKQPKIISKLDVVCLVGAIVGAILWVVFNSPAMAVIAMVLIDFVGGIPTQIHCWQKPQEETLIMFVMSGIGALFTLLAVQEWRITAVAFPLFLLVINIEYIFVLITRRIFLKKKRYI